MTYVKMFLLTLQMRGENFKRNVWYWLRDSQRLSVRSAGILNIKVLTINVT